MGKKTITAREIVKKYNVPYHTLNYYTAMGLLLVLTKSGNQRIYDEEEIEKRLRVISELAREGYPLNLIRKKITGV
jgi:DNA-binding transcriptional MerR regulator